MDLVKTINCLRAANASLDQIYLVLAIIETGAYKTPFFENLDELIGRDGFIKMILGRLRFYQEKFTKDLLQDYGPEDFLWYLTTVREFSFDPIKVKEVFNAIKKNGEEHYEFRAFERMDQKDAQQGTPPPPGPER